MLSRFADQDPLFVLLAVSVDAGLIAFAAWAAAQRLWTWAGDTRALAALRPTPAVAALRPTRAVAALRPTRAVAALRPTRAVAGPAADARLTPALAVRARERGGPPH